MTSLIETRADPDECRKLVERLYQEPTRTVCLTQLAESIRAAHEIAPSSWGVTLHDSEIRLNVGSLEALVLRKNEVGITVAKNAASEDEWLDLTTDPELEFKYGGQPFQSMESAYGVEISANLLETSLHKLRPLHIAHVEKSARGVKTRAHFYLSHSPGVMDYLRQTVTDDLPNPNYSGVEPPSDNSARRFWKISPGKQAKYWGDFKRNRLIAISWHDLIDLRSLNAETQTDFEKSLNAHPERDSYDKPHGTNQLWAFFREMQVGDLVCASSGKNVLGWGVITGEYDFKPLVDMAHQRRVDWKSTQPLATSNFSESIANKLMHQWTILKLSEQEFSQIMNGSSEDGGGGSSGPGESDIDLEALLHDLENQGLHFSAEIVSNYLLALQSKRFVILTGISGTGKTQLALKVANHFRQSVTMPRAIELPEEALVFKVKPYTLKYGHIVLPASFTANLIHPPTGRYGESRQISVEYPEGKETLTMSKDPDRNVTNLFFKGPFRKWFIGKFAIESQFAIELVKSDDGLSESLRVHVPTIVPETELLQNYVVSAVRPDWSDNRGLLGYFNPLIGSYVVTPFLRLLLDARGEVERAERDGRVPAPYFVILDEMNLARVEHYFSDFLSALESGEPIDLHDHAGIEEGETEDAIPVPRQLRVPQNVFFTGTVNVDETTYMFSPKVLDRAFTIELNRVDLESFGTQQKSPESSFTLNRFSGSLDVARSPVANDWVEFGDLMDGELRQVVLDLHTLLSDEDRHFGYRVANEIARFVVLAAEQTDGSANALWTALDLALLEKVLPKFHGTQQELEAVLTQLLNFVEPKALPRTAAKIQSMQRRLKRQGFTSFIE